LSSVREAIFILKANSKIFDEVLNPLLDAGQARILSGLASTLMKFSHPKKS
jgi:hypothetical protein